MSAVEPPDTRERKRKRSFAVVTVPIFLIALAVLASMLWNAAADRREIRDELTAVRQARDNLQALANRFETERKQSEQDRRVILDVLSHSRTAEDIPDLQCDRIVARSQGVERVCFYVPEGNHTLEIVSRWRARIDAATKGTAAATSPTDHGESSWRVRLLPSAGYRLAVTADDQKKQVTWELRSNHPDFAPRVEVVPLGEFRQQGSSWSSLAGVHLPNEISLASPEQTARAAENPPPVKLAEAQFYGPRGDVSSIVEFDVQISSEGPAHVTATMANTILRQRHYQLELTYAGAGKYIVRSRNHVPSENLRDGGVP